MNDRHAAHSALYFGETRDSWWNRDFLELMGKRLGLSSCRTVLDVGSGVGHWGRAIAHTLAPDFEITGVDREPRWVHEAARRADAVGLSKQCRYVLADAAELPFADESFELVTCQTVLIHVADPARVIGEMARVLKPGGRILLAEPNNIAGNLVARIGGPATDIDAVLHSVRLQMICERGKHALGKGYNSVGETILAHLDTRVFEDVSVHQTDRCFTMAPPYDEASVDEMERFARDEIWIWPKSEAREYFLAGGGEREKFDEEWARALELNRSVCAQIRRGEYFSTGGVLLYLVAATKRGA